MEREKSMYNQDLEDRYAEFLMANQDEQMFICNGDDLITLMESGVLWDEFMETQNG
jgi:hypothetical protein